MPRFRFSKVLTVLAVVAALALAGPPPARALSGSDAVAWFLSWLGGTNAASGGDEGSGLDPYGVRATTGGSGSGS